MERKIAHPEDIVSGFISLATAEGFTMKDIRDLSKLGKWLESYASGTTNLSTFPVRSDLAGALAVALWDEGWRDLAVDAVFEYLRRRETRRGNEGLEPSLRFVFRSDRSAFLETLLDRPGMNLQPGGGISGQPANLLCMAAARGAEKCARVLVGRLKAPGSARESRIPCTPAIHLAVSSGNGSLLRWLLTLRGVFPHRAGPRGETLLLSGAAALPPEDLRWLAESFGFDTAVPDGDGRTPLHAAAKAARLDNIQLLVSLGAPLESTDAKGQTPFLSLVRGVARRAAEEPWTLQEGIAALRFFADAGADIQKRDFWGYGAVHSAAGELRETNDEALAGQVLQQLAVALASLGVDLAALDRNGKNALTYAFTDGQTAWNSGIPLAQALAAAGVPVQERLPDGSSVRRSLPAGRGPHPENGPKLAALYESVLGEARLKERLSSAMTSTDDPWQDGGPIL